MSDSNKKKQEELSSLSEVITSCHQCSLCETRHHAVPGEGNCQSGFFFVGQAPGEYEDMNGKMFTGPSGKIFSTLLAEAGLTRQEIYMSNLVKCYLPKCRRPGRREIDACSRYLDRELEIICPKWIIPLGFHATRYIFMKFGIPRPPSKDFHFLFGEVVNAGHLMIMPLRHPTALFFNPEKKAVITENYRKLAHLYLQLPD